MMIKLMVQLIERHLMNIWRIMKPMFINRYDQFVYFDWRTTSKCFFFSEMLSQLSIRVCQSFLLEHIMFGLHFL